MSILKDNIITKRFLFPRKKKLQNPYIINAKGNKLSCVRQMRFKNAKMLIVFHAGSELVDDYTGSFAHEIDKMGINLLLVEYPGYSMSTGEANIIDILDLIPDVINNCETSVEKLIVFGRSLGAAYAVDTVAKFPEIKGLIIESGIADFYDRLTKRVNAAEIDCTEDALKADVLKYFNTKQKLKKYTGSTLIMHAKDDRIIGTEQALKNYEWANEPKKIKIFDNGVHKDIQFSNKREYFDIIFEFVSSID